MEASRTLGPRSIALFTAIALAALLGTADPAAAQTDMTGTWTFSVTVDAGAGPSVTTPTITFEQEGQTLTGQYVSETLGEADVTGTVDGENVSFSVNADMQGQPIVVAYAGTVDAEGVFTGTIDLAGLAQGTATGSKEEPETN